MWEGDFASAIEEFKQAGEAPPVAPKKRQPAVGNWWIRNQQLASLTLGILGYPERALVRNKESLTVARETTASRADLTFALYWSAFLNLHLRDPGTAYSRADEAFKLAHEHGLISFQNIVGFARG
jgi:hypothetical protein